MPLFLKTKYFSSFPGVNPQALRVAYSQGLTPVQPGEKTTSIKERGGIVTISKYIPIQKYKYF
jgi:hypothetical protein